MCLDAIGDFVFFSKFFLVMISPRGCTLVTLQCLSSIKQPITRSGSLAAAVLSRKQPVGAFHQLRAAINEFEVVLRSTVNPVYKHLK